VAVMVYHGGVRVEPGQDRVSIRHGGWLGARERSSRREDRSCAG
jgi:hypothetical protein